MSEVELSQSTLNGVKLGILNIIVLKATNFGISKLTSWREKYTPEQGEAALKDLEAHPEKYGIIPKNIIKYGKNFTLKLRSNSSLIKIEKSIAEESHQILNSSEFEKITNGFANKTPIQVEINGRTISYDDAPFSGMTWFEKNGFNIGREAFKDEEELIKTVLHEMHRLRTSTLRGSGSASEVTKETKAAFDFAEKTFNLFE